MYLRQPTLDQFKSSSNCALAIAVGLTTLIGCGSGHSGKPQGSGTSLFQSTSYPVTAVLVGNDQKPVYLESLSVHASPTSEVRKHLAVVIEQYQNELVEIEVGIKRTADEIAEQNDLKRQQEIQIVEEYEKQRPTPADSPMKARNPLNNLSKVRASKDNADSWLKQQRLERCEPIKVQIDSLEQQSNRLKAQLASVRAGFNDRVFNSLPAHKKSWKTGKDGQVDIDIPNDAPWTVWSIATHKYSTGKVRERNGTTQTNGRSTNYSETEIERDILQEKQVRWILEIPTDLDENKALHLDLTTAFDVRGPSVTTSGTDGPYFRLNAAR